VIVLDTNVLTELMRSQPTAAVFAWAAAQSRDELYTTSVNKAEILYGIAALSDGHRRTALAAAADAMFANDFAGRMLPFDEVAAVHYAEIVAERRREGRPIEAFDAQIAATALAAGASIATRDTGGSTGCGLRLIDPWTAPP
jgi:predicted nucleic acid-binding protein